MDGKQIVIFRNSGHGCQPWEGDLTRLNILPPIPLGEFFPDEAKYHLHSFCSEKMTVVQSLN